MDAAKLCERLLELCKDIDALKARLSAIEQDDVARPKSPSFDGVQSRGHGWSEAAFVGRLIKQQERIGDIRAAIADKTDELYRLRGIFINSVYAIRTGSMKTDDKIMDILAGIYLDRLTVGQIARKEGMQEGYIRSLHSKGKAALQKALDGQEPGED